MNRDGSARARSERFRRCSSAPGTPHENRNRDMTHTIHPSAAQVLIDLAALVSPTHAAVLALVVIVALGALGVALVARS